MGKKLLQFQKWDIVIIATVLLLAALIFGLYLPVMNESPAYAEIYLDGELVKTVSLAENQEFTVEGNYINTVTIQDGKIAVTASNCPGGDCIHCGWIGSTGVSIVCLPNQMEIRAVSASGDVDFVVG